MGPLGKGEVERGRVGEGGSGRILQPGYGMQKGLQEQEMVVVVEHGWKPRVLCYDLMDVMLQYKEYNAIIHMDQFLVPGVIPAY